jgi:predicted HTH transcriptional regulator
MPPGLLSAYWAYRHLLLGLRQSFSELAQKRSRGLEQQSAKIVELARAHGRISVADIVRATGANRSTVKSRLSVLVRDGVLSRHGQGRTTWYVMA